MSDKWALTVYVGAWVMILGGVWIHNGVKDMSVGLIIFGVTTLFGLAVACQNEEEETNE